MILCSKITRAWLTGVSTSSLVGEFLPDELFTKLPQFFRLHSAGCPRLNSVFPRVSNPTVDEIGAVVVWIKIVSGRKISANEPFLTFQIWVEGGIDVGCRNLLLGLEREFRCPSLGVSKCLVNSL